MKIQSKKKIKSRDKKPIVGSWSKVKIAGNLITNDGGGLEGLVGLEVLENYDSKTITKAKVRNHYLNRFSDKSRPQISRNPKKDRGKIMTMYLRINRKQSKQKGKRPKQYYPSLENMF